MDLRGNQSKSYAQCNESVYFICPDPDPLLQACASITLQSELKVNKNMKIMSIHFKQDIFSIIICILYTISFQINLLDVSGLEMVVFRGFWLNPDWLWSSWKHNGYCGIE